jgi:tetratricopeptide (TPR) repeat protein
MTFKKFSLLTAAAGLLVLAGCNIFNPNGAEESSCDSGNAECYIALGQSLINKKDFDGSMAAYSKAIAIDSTKSEAYWGYATAIKFKYNLTLPELLSDIDNAADTGSNGGIASFLSLTNTQIEKRVQLGTRISRVMGLLAERDSLTKWWQYLTDSTNKGLDPKFAARKAFITAYLAANSAHPSRSSAHFPLSDGKKTYSDAKLQYMPYLLYSATLGSCDLGEPGVFTNSDREWCNILFKGASNDSGLTGLGGLAERMKDDTVFQQDVNNKILDIQNGLSDLSTLLSQFAPGQTVDTSGGAPQQTTGNIDSIISSLGGTMVFYQFGDGLDNDGDGCIDEEIVDSADNDLDGFFDEDARLKNGNGLPTGLNAGPADGIDNDHNGTKDAADAVGEHRLGIIGAEKILGFVATGGGTTFIKIKKVENPTPQDEARMDIRIAIQADSLALPSRASLPNYLTKLQNAKTQVGGCWTNYP